MKREFESKEEKIVRGEANYHEEIRQKSGIQCLCSMNPYHKIYDMI